MISIIIPVYNSATTLDRCIRSLQGSDFPRKNYEIIVVDDCSTDNSAQIASRYPCRLLKLPGNSGAAVARNIGSKMSKGDILFFIDADVLIEPDVLKKIDSIFTEFPDIHGLVGAYRPYQPNRDFFSRYQTAFTYFNHEQCEEGIISWFWGACGAIRKTTFEKVGRFNEKYRGAGAEDIELGYDLSHAGYNIKLDKNINVVHCHKHTFSSILKNNLKKSSEWCALFLSKNFQNKYKHGFTSKRNGITISLIWVAIFLIFFYIYGIDTRFWIMIALTALTVLNIGYYRFILNNFGKRFCFKAIMFHWLTYFMIGIGVVIGTTKFLAGKT